MDGRQSAPGLSGHSLRRERGGDAVSRSRAVYYDRLMRVSYRHAYYNLSNEACTDLTAVPTAYSQRLMRSLGLLFCDEGTGFSILYDTSRAADLIAYLQRQGEDLHGNGKEFWSRLSFVLTARSAYFISVTDIPVDLDPSILNFYFTNQAAHVVAPGREVLLNTDGRVTADELLPIIPSQYPVPVPDDVLGVAVRAISGEVVLCEPRCVPHADKERPLAARCSEWLGGLPPVENDRCRDVIYLDFAALPEDKYSIEYVTGPGKRKPVGVFLYTSEAPTPLGFLDLLFSAPTPAAAGVYPVEGLAAVGAATIAPVDYILNFEARTTLWNYYIVPQPQRDAFVHLRIDSTPPGPEVRFAGPCCVVLPNGAKAYRFMSERPLILQEQSPFWLRLRGRRSARSIDDDVLVDRLPVAGRQVLPQSTAMARLGLVRSLCPEAERGGGCPDLIRQVFGGSRVSTAAGVERLRKLRTEMRDTTPSRHSSPRAEASRPRSYSDIYVYV